MLLANRKTLNLFFIKHPCCFLPDYDFFSMKHFLHTLLLLFIFSPDLVQAQDTDLREQDSLALVALYNSTNGEQWLNQENWLTGPLNDWFGVSVSQDRVVSLSLAADSLSGTLPEELGDLTGLTYLDLSINQLTGSIPSTLGNLSNLNQLYLHRNQLTGAIPATLGELENLVELLLFRNQLAGSLPAELGQLTNLQELWLFINELSGEIPSELGALTNLETLWISDNQFIGTLPAALGDLTNLSILYVYRNRLTGSLPVELGELNNLTELRVYGNFLTGSIPEQLADMDSLRKVSIHDNLFSFDDILPSLNQSYEFYYNPQRLLGETSTISLNTGDDYTIDLNMDESVSSSLYRWYKNHQFLTETTVPRLALTDVGETEAGVYHCVVVNPAVDDFALLTYPQTVTVAGALPCLSSAVTGGTYQARSQSAEGNQSYEDVTITPTSDFTSEVQGFERDLVITDSCNTLAVRETGQYGYPLLLQEADDQLMFYWLEDLSSERNTSFTVLTITEFTLVTPGAVVANAGEDVATTIQGDNRTQTIRLSGTGSSTYGNVAEENYVWTRNGEVIGTGPQIDVSLEVGTYVIMLTVTDALGNSAQDQVEVIIRPRVENRPSGGDDNEDDNTAPTVIRLDAPGSYAPTDEAVVLSVVVEDDRAITDYTLYYAGLTTPDFEANRISAPLTVSDNAYTFSLTAAAIDTLDDPLGIRYTFVLQDEAGNQTTETGATYRIYPDSTFRADERRVGPWREVAQPADPSTSDYNIIALPFEPQPVREVLSALGEPDPTQWRLFTYNTSSSDFQEYGTSGFSNFMPDQGYFLIMRDNGGIRFGGQIAEMQLVNDAFVQQLTLQPGWNAISNPFPFALDWDKVRADSLNDEIPSLQQLNRLTSGDDDYVPTTTLEAFEGAFLFWPGNSSQTLYLSPFVQQTNNGRQAVEKPTRGWELALVLEQDHFRSSRAGIGMRPTASEGLDAYDALSVPKPQAQPELLVAQQALPLNRSVVSETSRYTWSVQVAGVTAGEAVQLRWDSSLASTLPQSLYLWDASHSRLLNMGAQDEYQFVASQQDVSLQIYYGPKEYPGKALQVPSVAVGAPYPNPATTSFVLPLTLPPNQGQVEAVVTLTDLRGQQVGQYHFSSLSAGYQTLTIEIADLPAGLYHYQLRILGKQPTVFTGKVVKE